MKNHVLVFASGVGSRMRNTIGPKQFLEVAGKPILIYTLERFDNHDEIDSIYLVVRESKKRETENLISKFNINKVKMIVTDDDNSKTLSAHASIINGLLRMEENGVDPQDVVLIHDGVRPMIDKITISKCIQLTGKKGNAITSIPAFETIAHKGEDHKIGTVTKRDDMIVLQAPQGFLLKDALDVNKKAIRDNIVGTVVDQAELNRVYGNDLHYIEGMRGNVKITVPLDFTYFEFLVNSGRYSKLTEDGSIE